MMKAAGISLTVGAALLGACGGGSSTDQVDVDAAPVIDATPPTPDAPQFCAGFDLPTTAQNPVLVSGGVYTLSINGATPIGGADLQVYDESGTSLVGTTSVAQGNNVGDFALDIVTDGVPVNGYIEALAEGFITTRVYPPTPLAAAQDNVAVLMLSPENFDFLNGTFLQETVDPAAAWIGVAVLDAGGQGIAGATVSSFPAAGAVHYNQGGIPNSGATVTDDDGVAYLVNVPAGEVTVSATVGGTELRPVTFTAEAGLVSTTGLVPCSLGAE